MNRSRCHGCAIHGSIDDRWDVSRASAGGSVLRYPLEMDVIVEMQKQHFQYAGWSKGLFSELVTVQGPGMLVEVDLTAVIAV